ncbi:hypothetical protein GF357_02850 [Candidatus Dojkabacteria bacterium]|nr:hypothetical protein [Candidatus Dojkabacteria bacterium]
MSILPLEPMSYKEQKKINELVAQLRIVKKHKKEGYTQIAVAEMFQCSRNTVSTIIKKFNGKIPKEDQNKVLNETHSVNEIEDLLKGLRFQSTKPKGRHPLQAHIEQEEKVIHIFNNNLKVGPKRMIRHLKRAYGTKGNSKKHVSQLEKSLAKLMLPQMKGIYKRNNLKLEKRRSSNHEIVHLYDYTKIGAFEFMHLDTKHILDQGALPEEIYEKFSDSEDIPLYEWNLIYAKSRFRFISYSYNLTSEFGLKFLTTAIQYLRGCLNNYETAINVLTDGGSEFFRSSRNKQAKWNKILGTLNTYVDCYESGRDVRKNLIERSHKTDDEEFYVPRGEYIYDRDSFLTEARQYFTYFNALRPHSGIGMNGRTPLEVLGDTGLTGVKRLMNYPTMILEENIRVLSDVMSVIELDRLVQDYFTTNSEALRIDEKSMRDFMVKVPFLSENAQNVLTPYQGLHSASCVKMFNSFFLLEKPRLINP